MITIKHEYEIISCLSLSSSASSNRQKWPNSTFHRFGLSVNG